MVEWKQYDNYMIQNNYVLTREREIDSTWNQLVMNKQSKQKDGRDFVIGKQIQHIILVKQILPLNIVAIMFYHSLTFSSFFNRQCIISF